MSSDFHHSLLVPCYNAAKYIDRFALQLSKLTIPFNEVVFYDDGSTDETIFLLEKKGFKVIKGLINKGPGYARNRLAYEAKGEYIHFHDIDDEIDSDFLKLINQKLTLCDTDVILGYADWIDEISRASLILWTYDEMAIKKNPLAYFMSKPLGIINTVYKKSTFLNIGGFNENIKCWEDADLHIRLAAVQANFQVVNEIIAHSLRHANGISKDQEKCWRCRLRFLEIYLNVYLDKVDKDIFKQELKKVQTVFINMGTYRLLKKIFDLNKKYQLDLSTNKAKMLYYSSSLIPSSWLQKVISFAQRSR